MTDTPNPKRPPTERLTPAFRYQRDATFAALVNMMESHLHTADFTPTELREAVMLAAIRYESRRVPQRVTVFSGVAVPHGEDRRGGPPPVLMIDGVPYRYDPGALRAETDANPPLDGRLQFDEALCKMIAEEPDAAFRARVGLPKDEGGA
jgi:hypothetical protein